MALTWALPADSHTLAIPVEVQVVAASARGADRDRDGAGPATNSEIAPVSPETLLCIGFPGVVLFRLQAADWVVW